jgi:hypothetical protein
MKRTTLSPDFDPKAVIFVAPPFRHTHFKGKQMVVHNRRPGRHELFSYNLYPGPSAKKGNLWRPAGPSVNASTG